MLPLPIGKMKKYIKFCPKCKSTNVGFSGGVGGVIDKCRNCGYLEPSGRFPEIEESAFHDLKIKKQKS